MIWKNQIFSFHIYFHIRAIFFLNRFFITCIFECFQSHRHILKELHEFLCMMSAITIFEESIQFCELWIGDTVIWDWVHIWGGDKKTQNVKRLMWIFLQPN